MVGAVVGDERFELLEEVGAEVGRLGDGDRVDARLAELAVGARIDRRGAARRVGQAQLRIAEQQPRSFG